MMILMIMTKPAVLRVVVQEQEELARKAAELDESIVKAEKEAEQLQTALVEVQDQNVIVKEDIKKMENVIGLETKRREELEEELHALNDVLFTLNRRLHEVEKEKEATTLQCQGKRKEAEFLSAQMQVKTTHTTTHFHLSDFQKKQLITGDTNCIAVACTKTPINPAASRRSLSLAISCSRRVAAEPTQEKRDRANPSVFLRTAGLALSGG